MGGMRWKMMERDCGIEKGKGENIGEGRIVVWYLCHPFHVGDLP
jgi:hypothetical protein